MISNARNILKTKPSILAVDGFENMIKKEQEIYFGLLAPIMLYQSNGFFSSLSSSFVYNVSSIFSIGTQ